MANFADVTTSKIVITSEMITCENPSEWLATQPIYIALMDEAKKRVGARDASVNQAGGTHSD